VKFNYSVVYLVIIKTNIILLFIKLILKYVRIIHVSRVLDLFNDYI
jgi:hypothetical protein